MPSKLSNQWNECIVPTRSAEFWEGGFRPPELSLSTGRFKASEHFGQGGSLKFGPEATALRCHWCSKQGLFKVEQSVDPGAGQIVPAEAIKCFRVLGNLLY